MRLQNLITKKSTTKLLATVSLFGALTVSGVVVAQESAAPVAVESVQVVLGDQVEVLVTLNAEVEGAAVSAFTMTEPDRVVVDMLNVSVGDGELIGEGDGGLILSTELSVFEDDAGEISRLTLFLSGPATPSVDSDGSVVRVTLDGGSVGGGLFAAIDEAPSSSMEDDTRRQLDSSLGVAEGPNTPSGPQAVADAPSLSSLDYIDETDIARIAIGLNASIDYVSSQPEPNLVVLDFPGAEVPNSLTRALDASRFISPVRVVRAYSTRDGARVAVSLRESVQWSVQTNSDGLVYVDFTIPSEMQSARDLAVQGFSEVAPSTPETAGQEGLHSAYQSETLIGQNGRTMDPQAVFGTGQGADSPASMLSGVAGFVIDQETASSSQWRGRRINIDLQEAPIHAVFRLISHVSGLNIVSGDDVQGSVTVSLVDVPWDQAFSAVLQAKGLAAQRFGNIVRVAPIETIKGEQQAALEAQRAREELTPLQVLIIPLNYATASEVSNQIQAQLSSRGSVEVDSRSNQVIIKETEERLAQIRELVRSLDRETPQVLIEARVVEANSRYSRSLGIQWGGQVDASANTGFGTGLFFPSSVGIAGGTSQDAAQSIAQFFSPGEDNLAVDLAADGSFGSLAFNLGSVPGMIDLDARLSAMEVEGWGEIVSSPRITTLDNTSATIQQGARIPFLSSSSGGTQVQFITAALVMEVTPHITSDDKIFMKLHIENNRPDFSQTVQGQPAIQIKEADTELLVANGDTTVIGGVFSTEEAESVNRVPLFGQIPLLGWLFSSTGRNVSRNEMLVFVTPTIISRASED
jgi:type IV pilus assembly protein PilQ